MTSEPPVDPVQRRVAVVPVVVAVIALVAFAVVITIVITLATARAPGSSAQQLAPPSAPAESESEPADAPPPESSVISPSEPSTGGRCVDSTGEVDELDIDEVSLSHNDRGDLTVDFTLASAVPTGAVHLGIYAQDAKGDRLYQFFVEIEGREVASVTTYDFDREANDKVDADDAEVSGKTIRFEIPRKTVKKLGEDWEWSAFSALDGDAVDSCPGDPGSSDLLTFDRLASSSGNSDRDD